MRLFFLFVLVASFMGCEKKLECSYDPCSFVAPTSEIQMVQNYLATNRITATQHCSGLYYKIEAAGTGGYPDGCSTVTASYVGKLADGTPFDSGILTYNLQDLVRGWTIGVPMLKEGGHILIYVPPTLGYGNRDVKDNSGNVVIPANSMLIFDITLISVE